MTNTLHIIAAGAMGSNAWPRMVRAYSPRSKDAAERPWTVHTRPG
jgi:hypothetical protein